MGLLKKLGMYRNILARAQRQPATVRLLKQRPALMLGVGAFELGLMVSGRMDERLKTLALIKTSALIGCPF
jgi:hypothetical protein